ncbi:MAG: hypothetical protein WBP97_12060, partial [Candidatus Sulfotelmatobacter sp.]
MLASTGNIGIEKKKTTGDCEKMDSRKCGRYGLTTKISTRRFFARPASVMFGSLGFDFPNPLWADDGARQVFARHKLLPDAARLIKCAVIHYR